MLELKSPSLISEVRPVKEYMMRGAKTLDRFDANGSTNPSVLDDAEYKLDLDLFVVASKTHLLETQAWKENNARVYNLMLQHCPKELEAELRIHDSSSDRKTSHEVTS